jgi:hypothetical protein
MGLQTYTPDPVVTPIQAKPPVPFSVDNLGGFVPAAAPMGGVSAGFVTVSTNVDGSTAVGGSALGSLAIAITDENEALIREAAPGSLLYTLQVFAAPTTLATPMTPNGNSISWPVGTLFVLQQRNGASAVPVVAPLPAALVAVFGQYYGKVTFSDGVKRNAWSAFNGTTYNAGDTFFDGGPQALLENPSGVAPAADLYQIVNKFMGQLIVEIGTTAALPVTG